MARLHEDDQLYRVNLLVQACGRERLGMPMPSVGLDPQGLVADEVATLCQRQRVRLLYLTPLHHFLTTVTLAAARRMQLLTLAEAHDFIILEDDYDFDYHYDGSPILPLSGADRHGQCSTWAR